MQTKSLLATTILTGIFLSMGGIFWYQETRYLLPTPVPPKYQPVLTGEIISIQQIVTASGKPAFLHFFNPNCPCSRFNMDHFGRLVKQYSNQVNFYAVLHTDNQWDATDRFREQYALDIPVIVDADKQLAVACGVYSTPQAALIDPSGKLYYRGNYNKARYCTNTASDFARIAIDSMLAGVPAPDFAQIATDSYGCELPGNSLETAIISFK